MKKHIIAAAVLMAFAILPLSGCVVVKVDSVRGSGSLKSYEISVNEFTSVYIKGGFELHYSNTPTGTVTLEIQENLREYVTVEERNGKLSVTADRTFIISGNNSPRLYISSKTLSALDIDGAVFIDSCDTIESESLSIEINGAASLEIPLNVKTLVADFSGASDLKLTGSADNADFTINGAGSIRAYGLDTERASITVNGAGSCEISCSETLDVTINGIGSLTYKGDPTVTKNRHGIGSITKY